MHVKIVSWNVLGHKHTHYNYRHHRNGIDNVETEQQKNIRKSKNTRILNKIDPDILLLQEFSGNELDILTEYKSVINNIDNNNPECHIFYKKDKFNLLSSTSFYIGHNKNCVIAEFLDIIIDKKFKVVSFHLVGGKNVFEYQNQQLRMIENNLNLENDIIILGGDCNQKDISLFNTKITFIDSNEDTALIQNMTKPGKIDYFGVNKIGNQHFKFNGVYIKPNINPWSYRSIIGSDHVPLIGILEL